MSQGEQCGPQRHCGHHNGPGHGSRAPLIYAYDLILLAGLVLNVAILFIAYMSPKVHRSYAWFMFIISWIVLCLSYLFLYGQQTGASPEYQYCLTQAVLVYASPPSTAVATLAFVIYLYLGLNSKESHHVHAKLKFWSLLLPPLVFILVAVEALVIGLTHPEDIRRDRTGMFCHSTNKIPGIVNSVIIGVAVIFILGLEVALGVLLRTNWSAFLNMKRNTEASRTISLGVVIRLSLFTVAPLFAFIIELIIIPDSMRKKPLAMNISGVLFAVLPLFAALTFGTQMDILRALIFWRKDPISEKASEPPNANIA